jgi:glycosyltransferase involved in cell wall biosynthesis
LSVKIVLFEETKFNSFKIYQKLKKLLKDIKPDILHTHEYKSHILAIAANGIIKNKARVVRTLHGLTAVPFSLRYIKSKIILLIEQLLIEFKTDYVIAVSNAIENILKSKYNRPKIRHIPNGINIPLKINQNSEKIREKFLDGSNTAWIGTAVRLVQVKNIEMLIDAAKIMSESKGQSGFIITVFGSGPLSKKIDSQIKNYKLEKYVKMYPHYDDIISVFNAMDVFVLTSTYEGIPMSLLESMALGVIPVCTRVGGMQEIVQDKKTGFLIESGDSKALAAKLLMLCENINENNNIKENAKSRIEKHYSVKNTVELLNKVYKERKYENN